MSAWQLALLLINGCWTLALTAGLWFGPPPLPDLPHVAWLGHPVFASTAHPSPLYVAADGQHVGLSINDLIEIGFTSHWGGGGYCVWRRMPQTTAVVGDPSREGVRQ